MPYTKKELARKEAGMCIRCGEKVDSPDQYVQCAACRKVFTEYMKARKALRLMAEPTPNQLEAKRKMREEAEAAKQRRQYERQLEKCTLCEWSRLEGHVVYCPFPAGTCMKGVQTIAYDCTADPAEVRDGLPAAAGSGGMLRAGTGCAEGGTGGGEDNAHAAAGGQGEPD